MLRPIDREEDRCGATRVRPPEDGEEREIVLVGGAEARIDGLELPIDGLELRIDGLVVRTVGAALRILVGCLRVTFCRFEILGVPRAMCGGFRDGARAVGDEEGLRSARPADGGLLRILSVLPVGAVRTRRLGTFPGLTRAGVLGMRWRSTRGLIRPVPWCRTVLGTPLRTGGTLTG